MARAKNEPEPGTVSVNVDEFRRTRDSVIVALATLQSSVQDLSRAYIEHANTVLSGQNAGQLPFGLAGTLLESGLVGQQPATAPRATSPPHSDVGEGGKKKRKRAPHDPNAPKRALTPYFLYMQSARSKIASELGENAKPKEVADEGTRRWAAMGDAEKSVWNNTYAKNLSIYREKIKAYKAGLPVPDDATAEKLIESGAIAIPDVTEAAEEEEASPEPVKAPEPPKSNKRRKTGDKPATPAKDTATPAKKSPEKKKADKKEKAAPASAKAAAPAAESGKKKKSKK